MAQLIGAGAEHFDATALTAELGARAGDMLGEAAFYGNGDFHLHPAVHAEVNAALLDHLARGWALEVTRGAASTATARESVAPPHGAPTSLTRGGAQRLDPHLPIAAMSSTPPRGGAPHVPTASGDAVVRLVAAPGVRALRAQLARTCDGAAGARGHPSALCVGGAAPRAL